MSSGWNRIGDVAHTLATGAKNAGESGISFGKEVIGGLGGIAKMAWDIGTAPWNDAEEYNGFIQPLKTAFNKNQASIVKPLASAAGAITKAPVLGPALERINKINQEYIREPLTTFNLAIGDVAAGRGSFFDPNEWRKAYKGAQEISLGQSVLSYYRNAYDPKFNIYDPAQREAAFEKSMWGKFSSGGLDLVANFLGDVTLVAGKGIKALKVSELGAGVLKNSDAVAQAAEDITKAQYGVTNRFSKVIDDFTNNNSAYALSHPMVKSSSQPGLLAHLLGDSVDRDETALILRSALGDPAAMDELRLQRAYITDALETARGDLSAVDEYKLFAAPDGTGMIPFLNESEAVIKAAEDNYRSLAASDEYFAKLMGLGEGGGTLTRTTGFLGQGVEDFVAKARAVKFYDKTVGNPRVEIYQPTPFHRMYQKFSWGLGERPAGIVDFNDPDSYKEVIATVNRAEKVAGLTPEDSLKLLNSYIAAATPEARSLAALNMEGSILRKIASKYDLDADEANNLYNIYKGARMSALKSIKDKGFMVDLDGTINKVQQLESQSADYLPLMDFELLDRVLKQVSSPLKAILSSKVDATLNVMDVVQDLFKAGALLRLGYTQRNAIDSQLRIASAVGAMASLRHVGPGLKNLLNNSLAVPSRLIDRYRPVDGGRRLVDIRRSSEDVINKLNVLKQEIKSAEADLAMKPGNTELMGKVNTLKELQKEKQAVYDHYVEVLNRYSNQPAKARIGTGSFEVVGTDGEKYILDDAFGGPLGDMFRRLASSSNSFGRMVDSNSNMYMRELSYKGIQAIRPTDPGYFEQWAQTLRQQFGNSAVIKKLAAGEPIENVSTWLRNSPEGRDLRRRLSITSDDAKDYVLRLNNYLDNYLPAESGLRSKLREITAVDLRSTFKDPTTLPIIHGHLLEEAFFNKSENLIRRFINQSFKILGTLPEDAWARNPLYIYFYRREASRRLQVMTGLKQEGRLTVEEQQKLMAVSHKVALREMKNVLFNIERRSNLAAAFKYISPFFSAQENAVKTWLKLTAANPAIANRGYLVWNAPNKAGLVTDQEGNEVPAGQTTGNDIIWVGMPKGLKGIPGLNTLTKVGIPKGSLDIMFQGGLDVLYMKGNPNIFSDIFPVGPYIGIPVSEVVKKQPQLEDAFKWALPFGPSKDAISALEPAWFQKLQTRFAGQSDPQFALICSVFQIS